MDDPKKKGVGLIIGIGGPPKVRGPMDQGEPEGDELPPTEHPSHDHPEGQQCSNCNFYLNARCQRFPPHGAEWSQVTPEDYCGEWLPKDEHEPAPEAMSETPADEHAEPQPAGAMR